MAQSFSKCIPIALEPVVVLIKCISGLPSETICLRMGPKNLNFKTSSQGIFYFILWRIAAQFHVNWKSSERKKSKLHNQLKLEFSLKHWSPNSDVGKLGIYVVYHSMTTTSQNRKIPPSDYWVNWVIRIYRKRSLILWHTGHLLLSSKIWQILVNFQRLGQGDTRQLQAINDKNDHFFLKP